MGLPDRLRLCRSEKGLSQEALARAADVSYRSYCSWEAGRTRPNPANLLALAGFYGKPMEWFLKGD